jgi:Protein of unknown function (DUF3224)
LADAVAPFTNETYEEEKYGEQAGTALGRVHITRSFRGDIEGTATAELLTATAPDGSAAYVALDAISGKLGGREGSFVLEHHGSVSADGAVTAASIVPGSGTGQLTGLRGGGRINADADGNHELVLEYELGA